MLATEGSEVTRPAVRSVLYGTDLATVAGPRERPARLRESGIAEITAAFDPLSPYKRELTGQP